MAKLDENAVITKTTTRPIFIDALLIVRKEVVGTVLLYRHLDLTEWCVRLRQLPLEPPLWLAQRL